MSVRLNVDPAAVRSQVSAAIEEHRQLIADLRRNLPEFPAGAAGVGFAAGAGALSDAMVDVQNLTIRFLENRVTAWEQIIALVDAIEQRDSINAGDLEAVDRP